MSKQAKPVKLTAGGASLPKIDVQPIAWQVLPQFYPRYGMVSGGITIERREGRDWIAPKFGVYVRGSLCLSKSGSLDYEPIPSERTDEYLAEHRFDTFEDAEVAAVALANRCLSEDSK